MRILCAGHLIRHPVGGHTWHHLQYLIGLARLGHEVSFVEHYGWPGSCYDPTRGEMSDDPATGIAYLRETLDTLGFSLPWCYLAADGQTHGMTADAWRDRCASAEVYLNLSNTNAIEQTRSIPRRALVDTDPVFTQIGAHGMDHDFDSYDRLFTYGENVHRVECDMPTGGFGWIATRQPVVLDLWPVTEGADDGAITTIMNWSAYGDHHHEGRTYGQKDRQFEPYFDLPNATGCRMRIAVNGPEKVRRRLDEGGWRSASAGDISRTPFTYQQFIRASRGEFCVAKHGYVTTGSGWFSDRSAAYLASGRPAVLEDTGFSRNLPTGRGLLTFREPDEARAALASLESDYELHCRAARTIAEEYFDADTVLGDLLERLT